MTAFLGSAHLSDPFERERSLRLARGDVAELIELYDEVASFAYGFAIRLTGSRRQASDAVRRAFVHLAECPEVFVDRRVSSHARVLLEVNHAAVMLNRERTRTRTARRWMARLRSRRHRRTDKP